MNTNNLTKNKCSIVLSVIALLLSAVTIVLVCHRIEPVTWDSLGVLIGVLSLLVTVLIGYQIWQIIDLKGIRKEIELVKENLENRIKKIEHEAEEQKNQVWCGYYHSKSEQHKKDTPENIYKSVVWGLIALKYGIKVNNKHELQTPKEDNVKAIVEYLIGVILNAKKCFYRQMFCSDLEIHKKAKDDLLSILGEVMNSKPDIDVSVIYDYINRIKTE